MTIETFTPPQTPDQVKITATPRVRTCGFGDGYVQRSADGLNAEPVTCELGWSALLPADSATIAAFFSARGGHEAFYYTAPGDAQRKYTNGAVARTVGARRDSIAVTLTEVFDP